MKLSEIRGQMPFTMKWLEWCQSIISHRPKHIFKYASVDMVKEIGPELLLALVLVAVVAAMTPVGKFVGDYLGGGLGYLLSLIFGLMLYICSTVSVPMVHTFVSQELNIEGWHGVATSRLLAGGLS